MNTFTIKDIENLTGIKSHTLRIWEQRYGIPKPKRTATNIRYYDDDDLKLLLNVSLLNKQGHRISKITALSKKEMEELALSYSLNASDSSVQLDGMMSAMFNLDEASFERLLSTHLLRQGLEKTLLDLFFPFMQRLGSLWQAGHVNPAFEHFFSNLIRQKVIVAIDAQSTARKKDAKTFVLYLPKGEMHELGLLFANYLIRSRGHHSIYLGQNLPCPDLKAVMDKSNSDYILTVLTNVIPGDDMQKYIFNLAERFKSKKIIITGRQVCKHFDLDTPDNVTCFYDMNELMTFMDDIKLA
jgi:MerR family transcriptional regulator, light-induced transcriptional regulator